MPVIVEQRTSAYESANALYREFTEQIAQLYSLAFLVTGDREQSIQAFGAALNGTETEAANGSVSPRRCVIAAALALADPRLQESIARTRQLECREILESARSLAPAADHNFSRSDVERALLGIDLFPRCAVLLSVFEGLSIKETGLALKVDESLVRVARAQGVIELTRNMASSTPREFNKPPRCSSRTNQASRFDLAASYAYV